MLCDIITIYRNKVDLKSIFHEFIPGVHALFLKMYFIFDNFPQESSANRKWQRVKEGLLWLKRASDIFNLFIIPSVWYFVLDAFEEK